MNTDAILQKSVRRGRCVADRINARGGRPRSSVCIRILGYTIQLLMAAAVWCGPRPRVGAPLVRAFSRLRGRRCVSSVPRWPRVEGAGPVSAPSPSDRVEVAGPVSAPLPCDRGQWARRYVCRLSGGPRDPTSTAQIAAPDQHAGTEGERSAQMMTPAALFLQCVLAEREPHADEEIRKNTRQSRGQA